MGMLYGILSVLLVVMTVVLYLNWANSTSMQRIVQTVVLSTVFVALCATGYSVAGRLVEEKDKFISTTLEARVIDVSYVYNQRRAQASIVVITTEGNFEFQLDQVVITGKSCLVKKAGSEKYELR